MIHRHLSYPAGTSPDQLPSAALVDLLDRGDLEAWRPIAAAIRADPMGLLAERVLQLLDAYPMYGTTVLWRAWIERCRVREEAAPQASQPVELATLRRRAGLTQKAAAARMGISQSDLSKLERRKDARLSTLRAYAKALGGRIETIFEAQEERHEVRIGAVHDGPSPHRRKGKHGKPG